jgi:hypothetical protein
MSKKQINQLKKFNEELKKENEGRVISEEKASIFDEMFKRCL